jgi:hypothetical protein
MIISANQPYFAPYPGFFVKALLSDVLVILDEVQFPHGTTWISRNRFKYDQGELWLTIPVWKKGLGDQWINQVRICYEGRWLHKHLESLKTAYGNAPYLSEHLGFLEELLSSGLPGDPHQADTLIRFGNCSQGNPTPHRDLPGAQCHIFYSPEPDQEIPRSRTFPTGRY